MDNNRISVGVKQAKFRLVASNNGVSLISSWRGCAAGGNHGKRGAVEGFSKASARRLRHLLMSVDYTGAVAVTLTHPIILDGMRGPEASFDALSYVAKRIPSLKSLIWRKEVTLAGMPHYHCILFPADGVDGVEASEELICAWIDSCLANWNPPKGLEAIIDRYRADMMKAHHDKRRPAIQVMDGSCYVRYILDHESKHKKEQSNTKGRAWGVWRRNNLPCIRVLMDKPLTDEQYWVFSRIMRKATRYLIKVPCVFGSRHSKGRRARGLGTVDYFASRNDGVLASMACSFVLSGNYKPLPYDYMAAGRYFRKQYEPR